MHSLAKSLNSPVQANVTGNIPPWLSGTLFRNGGGLYELNGKKMYHLFDGQACVHKFEINEGKVVYFNKLLESKSYKMTVEENRFGNGTFGTPDMHSSLFGRLKTLYNSTSDNMDNTNVNIVPFAQSQIYALTETNYLLQIDPKNLDIIKKLNVTDYIPTSNSIIAHPHVEQDGSWIDMGQNVKKPGYDFVKYDGKGLKDPSLNNILENGKLINCIPSSHGSTSLSYFHSFGLSENFIIFLEQSLKINFLALASGLITKRPFMDCMQMDSNWNTRIHLINRHTGEIVKKKFHTDPIFFFHAINSFEQKKDDKTEIYVDLCSYNPSDFDVKTLRYDHVFTDHLVGSGTANSLARRITIPFDSASSNKEESTYCNIKDLNSNHRLELPTINYSRVNTLPYKYTYGVNFYKRPFSVVKINVKDPNEALEYICDTPTEPIFVENPNPTSEDDGVLLVMCLGDESDYLSILDAKTMKEIAKASLPSDLVPVESRGGYTFHGFFADNLNYKNLNKNQE